MARNRKHQSAAVRFGPAVKAFILCVVIGGAGVGYVWQQSQITELARQIKQREQRLKQLKDQNEQLRTQLARLRSPEQLTQQIQKLNLGLTLPPANQVWALPEPASAPAVPEERLERRQEAPAGAGLAMH